MEGVPLCQGNNVALKVLGQLENVLTYLLGVCYEMISKNFGYCCRFNGSARADHVMLGLAPSAMCNYSSKYPCKAASKLMEALQFSFLMSWRDPTQQL
jgi:hypothetical protein